VLPGFNLSDDVFVNQESAPIILGDDHVYQIVYSNLLYYPVMYLLPLGSLAYLNVKLISSLNRIKRRTRHNQSQNSTYHRSTTDTSRQRRQRKDDNITQCVVAIVCVFIVCQTPALFNQIFWALIEAEGRNCGQFHFYYTKLSDVLVVLNSSCNFIIYCLFGRTFRRIFLSSVCGCCGYSMPTSIVQSGGAVDSCRHNSHSEPVNRRLKPKSAAIS
jgi:7 transmembrane receptor (rhodopsin family)